MTNKAIQQVLQNPWNPWPKQQNPKQQNPNLPKCMCAANWECLSTAHNGAVTGCTQAQARINYCAIKQAHSQTRCATKPANTGIQQLAVQAGSCQSPRDHGQTHMLTTHCVRGTASSTADASWSCSVVA